MGSVRLTAPLVPRGPAAAVVLDEQTVATVGEGAKQFPVVATVNGYTWRTSVARRGGDSLIGLSRAVREAAGVEPGDTVDVERVLDTAPREAAGPDASEATPRPSASPAAPPAPLRSAAGRASSGVRRRRR